MRFAILGVLFVLVGLPFYYGKVKPNSWSGFRTGKTMSDPNIWYAANKTMGLDFMIAGIVLFAFSLSVAILDHYHSVPVLKINFCAFIALMLIVVTHCFWSLSRL
jgi:uncharacterized membrane protein